MSGRHAAIGHAVEAAISAIKKRHIPMNIDGITAVIFCELGFEPELGRGLFALSRAVGILAHAWEQKQAAAASWDRCRGRFRTATAGRRAARVPDPAARGND